MVVGASYLLWVQRRLFLGPIDEPANRGLIDLDRIERGVLLMMTIPIVFIGVYPNPVLRRIEPAVLEILNQMEQRFVPEDASETGVGVEVVLIDVLPDAVRGRR
jgi:NADH-quinone oxidoreductase subunit M